MKNKSTTALDREAKRRQAEIDEKMRMISIRNTLYESVIQASRLGVQSYEMVNMLIGKFDGHSYRDDFVMVYALRNAMKQYKEIMDSGVSIVQYEESKK